EAGGGGGRRGGGGLLGGGGGWGAGGRPRHKMVVAELQEAVKRGAGFVELRLDFLAKAIDFKRLVPYKQCPWVATLRRPADGGRFGGTEAERQVILRQAIVSGAFEWVDLETDI